METKDGPKILLTSPTEKVIDDADGKEASIIKESKAAINEIVRLINSTEDTDEHNQQVYQNLNMYISRYNRILYSQISKQVFDMSNQEDSYDKFLIRLEQLCNFCDKRGYVEEKKIFIKLYDHAELANSQYTSFNFKDEYVIRIMNPQFEEYKTKIDNLKSTLDTDLRNNISDVEKSTTNQLISIVAIFTGMAFVMFGGISSISNVLSGLGSEIAIAKLCLLLCIVGLIFLSAIYMFITMICSILGKSINKILFAQYGVSTLVLALILIFLVIFNWIYM